MSIHCAPSPWMRCVTTIEVDISFLKVHVFLSFHTSQETRRTGESNPTVVAPKTITSAAATTPLAHHHPNPPRCAGGRPLAKHATKFHRSPHSLRGENPFRALGNIRHNHHHLANHAACTYPQQNSFTFSGALVCQSSLTPNSSVEPAEKAR